MSTLALGPRLSVVPRLHVYTALLPLRLRALGEAVADEVADNPWLELVPPTGRPEAEAFDALANVVDRPGLAEHLLGQLTAVRLDPPGARCARLIVGSLDPDGYLRENLPAIARTARTTEAVAGLALAAVQALEPAGVAARDLGERFRIELARESTSDGLALALTYHLEALARSPAVAAERLGTNEAAILLAREQLRKLDPHPARDFGPSIDYVRPELVFERGTDGWTARVDDRHWPQVRFVPLAFGKRSDGLREARARARSLIDALERRRSTLQRIGDAIAREQAGFLDSAGNPDALAPLSGRQLARAVGCAESTVSRALAARYGRTPFGVVALRAFLATQPGTLALTTAQLRERVREAFANANGRRSDAEIAHALALSGIRIARRTVAKYRAQLTLPSSRRRPAP